MTRASTNRDAESAILLRMAESRAALLVAKSTLSSAPAAHARTRPPAASLISSMTEAPRVTLLLALCLGAVILGPRRTFVIAGRSGITAWLGSSVRKVILKSL